MREICRFDLWKMLADRLLADGGPAKGEIQTWEEAAKDPMRTIFTLAPLRDGASLPLQYDISHETSANIFIRPWLVRKALERIAEFLKLNKLNKKYMEKGLKPWDYAGRFDDGYWSDCRPPQVVTSPEGVSIYWPPTPDPPAS